MGSIGLTELLVILALVLLFFGGRKLPELARGMGEGIRNFRDAMRGDQDEKKDRPS